MKVMTTIFIASLILFEQATAYRILGIFPTAGYSHYALGKRLMIALAEKGHDVTMIAPIREKNVPKSYRQIQLSDPFKDVEGTFFYFGATYQYM